jgi:radical SAM superfamily enzyme YgiQ (UPF0313 family)
MKVALVGAELEENLALRYLHAALAAAGHEAEIFDFHEAAQTPDIVRAVMAYSPHLVGLSMVFTSRAREFVRLAQALRTGGFAGHLTAGGHFASFHADNLLTEFPAFNSCVHGEGEETLPDLAANLADAGSVAGLTYRTADGLIRRTATRANPDDLDTRPAPTRPPEFDTCLGLPIANMLSSRGCFGRCNFCSINAWYRENSGKRFRHRRPDRVAAEMAGLYHERGVRVFNFHDDNFFLARPAASVARLREMKQHLDALGVGRIAIQVKARPDSLTPEVVAALADLGCFRVFLGVESNAVAGLKALGRGIRREQNDVALRLVREAGMHVTFNLLWFEPDASLADVRDNIEFMRRWSMVPLNFCRTEVYTGTPLQARLRAEGRLLGDYFGYHYKIADPRVQRAFDIGRRVFTPRQFALDGLNLEAMRTDYCWHLLKHFWPVAATPAVGIRVKQWIQEVNADSADRMEAICKYVETHDVGNALAVNNTFPPLTALARGANGEKSVEEFAADLAEEREALDVQLAKRGTALFAEICSLVPRTAESRRQFMFQAAGVAGAAAAMLLAPKPAFTAMAEMVPADTHAWELIAEPHDKPHSADPAPPLAVPTDTKSTSSKESPKDQPKETPTKETPKETPKDEKPLPADVATAVQKRVQETYLPSVKQLAEKMKDGGKPLETKLFLTADGSVDHVLFRPGDDTPGGAFLDKLTGQIFDWRFPDVKQAGTCTLKLDLPAKPAAGTGRNPRLNGGMQMFEMAPRD